MDISIIVPVYNGEKTIARLFDAVQNALGAETEWEVLFVHDAGRDNSREVIKQLVIEGRGRVRGFSLDRNYGQHNAILYGISRSSGDYIVTMDEDMQHDPSYIPDLLNEIIKGNYDVVYARFGRLKHPGIRIATSEMLRQILRKIVSGLSPWYSPYRIIKAPVAYKITHLRNPYTFIDGYLGKVTDKFGYINCEHRLRSDGNSSYTFYRLFRHAINIAIAYSPLKRWLLADSLILYASAGVFYLLVRAGVNAEYIIPFISLCSTGGFIFLLMGLTAEIIHYRGLKSNSFPVATEIKPHD